MPTIKKDILSKWVAETGRYCYQAKAFVDRKTKESERIIQMTKVENNGRQVLAFIGGPTGFESYYIDDLILTGERGNSFCICGGTINSWPACYVDSGEVFEFINS